LRILREKGFKVKGLFYNPNIHPFSEYLRRKDTLNILNRKVNLEIFYPEYRVEDFFRKVNLSEEKNRRCPLCWELRLENTAEFALKNGFDFFSTTLLVSPYQDQGLIKKIGEEIAQRKGIKFYYEDFRAGFKQAHREAKEEGLYCQNYCGCIYSEIERCRYSAKS